MPDPVLQVYRKITFDYSTQYLSRGFGACQCVCFDNNCTGLDALVYGQNDYHCKPGNEEECAKLQNELKPLTSSRYRPMCSVCNDIATVLTHSRKGHDPNFRIDALKAGVNQYQATKAKGEASIQEAIDALEQKRAHFETQAAKIRALKDKVRVATEVLHNATGKLGTMGASFNTLEQQNGLQYKDRVPVGIPYLPPFFTLSNRNFVIMMVCINVLLLVGIIAYAFVGRIRTDADVVATRGAATGESDSGNGIGASPEPAPGSAAPTPPSSASSAPEAPQATEATEATESSSASSTFDEPEAAPSESASAAASGSSEDTASSSASSNDASTGRARGGRRRSSLSAGRRYAD